MTRGFVYLFAVRDWASRRVLAWRLSNTLTTDFCIEAVQEALASEGTPTIFNTDQGCQFTSQEFTGLLNDHGIPISMDGTGCWRDNVFVERLWRSVKYEEVYLRAYDSISAARQGVGRYLTFYTQTRPHRALDGQMPDQVYCDNLTTRLTAASSEYCEAPLKKWNILSKQLRPPLVSTKSAAAQSFKSSRKPPLPHRHIFSMALLNGLWMICAAALL